jgi:hypothetical protein
VSEVILVMPNAFTKYQGSMYSNSVAVGDWETFVARDLVAWVDCALPHARHAGEPRPRGPFDGRLRHAAHRNESSPVCSRRSTP